MSDPDTKRRFRGDPLAVKGAIDSAWVIHKAHLLKLDANKLQKTVSDRDAMSRSGIPRKITRDILRLHNNVDKIDTALFAVNECYQQISEHGNKTMEANLDFNMSELKKANEAMRKALERKNKLVNEFITSEEQDVHPCPQLDEQEITLLASEVKKQEDQASKCGHTSDHMHRGSSEDD